MIHDNNDNDNPGKQLHVERAHNPNHSNIRISQIILITRIIMMTRMIHDNADNDKPRKQLHVERAHNVNNLNNPNDPNNPDNPNNLDNLNDS